MQTMTTWKQPRKKAVKRQKVVTIGLAVLTCFCGIVAGYWWGYRYSKVHQLTFELERTKIDLTNAQFELEKVSKTSASHITKISDMHNNIEADLLRFFDVFRKHSKVIEAADKNVSKDKKEKTKRELEMMWESEFSPLKDHLTQLENTLAGLENREPRDFDLPAPPSMMVREIRRHPK
ncbi:MAG TPA: hypothetical protein VFC02_27675 [Anaerolineales bacterium]|nr:hypothetical protein [Anaerolineales bacterium]